MLFSSLRREAGGGGRGVLSVNSPTIILSKNSDVSLAKIGKKSAKHRLTCVKNRLQFAKIGPELAKIG